MRRYTAIRTQYILNTLRYSYHSAPYLSLPGFVFVSLLKIYFSRSNSTKSPASDADNFSEPAGLKRARSHLSEDHSFCNRGEGVDSIRLITLLIQSCDWGERAVRFVGLTLKVVKSAHVDVILRYFTSFLEWNIPLFLQQNNKEKWHISLTQH
jgi:hypothetical protein